MVVSSDESLYKTEIAEDFTSEIEGVCGEASEYIWEYREIEGILGSITVQNTETDIYVTFELGNTGFVIKKLYLHLSRYEICADNFDSTAPVYMADISKDGVLKFTFKVDRKWLNFPYDGTYTYNDGYPFYFASHGIVKTGESNEPSYKSVQYSVTNCE